MNTSVAFLIFNRPNTTQKVFESIRQAKPPKLFVIADGPRKDRAHEDKNCEAVRLIIEQVDWSCQVMTNYSEINLGCKDRVSSGLDWVFEQVEEAIILEDDCVPDPTFFRFCEELLDYYRNDRRIMAISGDNFQFGRKRTEDSYYFSRYNHCWGWATWRRAWQHYDIDMKLWPVISEGNWLASIFENRESVKRWHNIFQSVYDEKINSWAYRWTFACWIQSSLTILPNVNLISNIGFGVEGTHTTNTRNQLANLPVEMMNFPLQHPLFMMRNTEADDFTEKNSSRTPLLKRLRNKIVKNKNQ